MTRHAPFTLPSAERRLAGLGAVLLVHAAFIVCWQLARTAPPVQPDGQARSMTWIRLARPVAQSPVPPAVPARAAPRPRVASPAAPATIVAAPQPPSADAPVLSAEAPAGPPAATILENARRSVGAIERARRKENRPYIVAPPDSPAIRLRAGMERAHDMVAPRLWEAPKVDELVNQTGDGARRTRVMTANGTYCITDRATTSSIDTIETLGKQRLATCPQHEDTATQQDWRTARGE